MLSVFFQTARGYRLGMGVTAAGLFAISLLVVYVFQAFGGLEVARQMEQFLPESIKALLKAQGGFATDANGFLAADYRHPIYLIALSAFVIASGTGAVAREVERGTVLVVLACPIARWRFLSARVGAMVAGLAVLLAGAWLGTWVGSVLTGLTAEVHMSVFLKVVFNAGALALAVGGYTLLISALSSDGAQATAQAAGITVAMFFLDFLATLWGPAEPLGPLSIFRYYDPLAIADNGGVPWRDVGVLLAVGAVGFAAALAVFQRRDIAR